MFCCDRSLLAKLSVSIRWYRLGASAIAFSFVGLAGCQSLPSASSSAPPENVQAQVPITGQANSQTEVQSVTLVEGLEHPWGLAWLPDGTILVTERPGRLRIIRDGQLLRTAVPGVPAVFAQNQGGLFDVSVHPNFAENRLVYFTYSDGTNAANRTHVARAVFENDRLSDWQVIFEASPSKPRGQHFGSRLTWLPDGTLLASIGDGGNPPIRLGDELIRQQAQNKGSHLGKIVRLNDDGSVPADNPFVNEAGAEPEVWSYGHRNIQGLTFDSLANRVWASEHGSRGGDEVNLIEGGENYGWPVATHSREYSGGLISPEQSLPGMVDPVVIWTPSIAPSGLAFYSGDRIAQWQGQLFAGGLVSADVRRLEIDESGSIISETSIPIGQRVRDVKQGPDDLLYVLTDEDNGQLIRLEPEPTDG